MKLQPFRDEALSNPTDLRNRLNELVRRVNESSGIVRHVRIPNIQTGMQVVLASPSFTVGAILLGGVSSTSGGTMPAAAPWVTWEQLGNGSIKASVRGLAASPAQYAVDLVLVEAGGVV